MILLQKNKVTSMQLTTNSDVLVYLMYLTYLHSIKTVKHKSSIHGRRNWRTWQVSLDSLEHILRKPAVLGDLMYITWLHSNQKSKIIDSFTSKKVGEHGKCPWIFLKQILARKYSLFTFTTVPYGPAPGSSDTFELCAAWLDTRPGRWRATDETKQARVAW